MRSDNFTSIIDEESKVASKGKQLEGCLSYTNSDFAVSVQHYLRQFINTNKTFKDQHRSMFYQKSLKEVKIGIIGPGTSFGDIDASRNRHYMYTLRTASIHCKIFEINANDFICFIKSHGKEAQFN